MRAPRYGRFALVRGSPNTLRTDHGGCATEFIHSYDFISAKPLPDWLQHNMGPVVASIFAVEGEDYVCYLADAREVTDAKLGEPLTGDVSFKLPQGQFRLRLILSHLRFILPGPGGGRRQASFDHPGAVSARFGASNHPGQAISF